MTPRLAQYGMLWRAALAMIHPRAPRVVLWFTSIATVAAAALGGAGMGLSSALQFGWNTPFILLLATWTWGYLPGAFKLNTPANAQLTPGMRDRLVELSAALWLACLIGLVIGTQGSSADVVLRLLWFLLASLGIGLAAGSSALGSWLLIGIWPLMVVRSYLSPAVLEMVVHPLFLPLAAAVLAVPGLLAIRAMFPRAGDRHWRLLACRNIWRDSDVFGKRDTGKFLGWWQGRSLRRAGARLDLGGMLLHGSGPGLQAGEVRIGIGVMGLLGLGVVAFAHLGGHAGLQASIAGIGWMWSLAPLVLFQTHAILLASLPQRSGGQALLRLAPVMPATAPRFNRLLALRMLRSVLGSWAAAAVTGGLLAWLSGADAQRLLWFASLCCVALPLAVMPLRNHARRPRWNAVLQWLAAIAVSGACVLAGALAHRLLGLPVLPASAVLAIALTATLAVRRYGVVLRAPFALPAGRLD